MSERFTIVGIGEALYDIFPDHQALGGAPLNVVVHAHRLAQAVGGRAVLVSRIGQDAPGTQMRTELQARQLSVAHVQTDPDHPTGKVYVTVGPTGEPAFDIVKNVAWDWLSFDPDDEGLARSCEAVCFGALAQREGQSRNSIYRFLEAAPRAARLFDVNLRQNYYDRRIILRSLEYATVVKLNQHELEQLTGLLNLETGGASAGAFADPTDARAMALLRRHKLQAVVLTRGSRGTCVFTSTGKIEGAAASYPATAGADAVGAGDACSAGVLLGMVLRWPWERTLKLANHCGAFVAAQPGATPELPGAILDMLR